MTKADWVEFRPSKKMSDIDWQRFVAMIGESEFTILDSNDGEDVQGYWVQHCLAISPQGISNLRRCRDISSAIPDF